MVFSAPEIEPVALIGEADGKQERSQTEEAKDAIALAELAYVDEKNFADGNCKQNERLPAEEGG